MAHTIDDVALVDTRVVSKCVSVYGTVLHHVVVRSTASGLSFGREHAGLSWTQPGRK